MDTQSRGAGATQVAQGTGFTAGPCAPWVLQDGVLAFITAVPVQALRAATISPLLRKPMNTQIRSICVLLGCALPPINRPTREFSECSRRGMCLGPGGQALACRHFHGEVRRRQALAPALETQAGPASRVELGLWCAGRWQEFCVVPSSSAQRTVPCHPGAHIHCHLAPPAV